MNGRYILPFDTSTLPVIDTDFLVIGEWKCRATRSDSSQPTWQCASDDEERTEGE